jgi:hypothetical protein
MINDDKFEKIKQDIEGSLIELVDEGYKVDVTHGSAFSNLHRSDITVSIKVREVRRALNHQDIGDIKEYVHHLYDLMVYHKFELDHVNIKLLYETSEIPVRLLSSTGKLSLESDFL